MRLLVTEGPPRRKLRIPRESRVFCHDGGRIRRCNKKDVEWPRPFGLFRLKPAARSAEVEGAGRLVKEHRPPRGSDQPGDRHASAMCPELISPLAADHSVDRAATIELRTALS